MSCSVECPFGDATVALALSASAADLERLRVGLRLAELTMLRAARAMVDAQALTVRMIRAAEELDPQKREEPEAAHLRLPQSCDSSTALDTIDPSLAGDGAHPDSRGVRRCAP